MPIEIRMTIELYVGFEGVTCSNHDANCQNTILKMFSSKWQPLLRQWAVFRHRSRCSSVLQHSSSVFLYSQRSRCTSLVHHQYFCIVRGLHVRCGSEQINWNTANSHPYTNYYHIVQTEAKFLQHVLEPGITIATRPNQEIILYNALYQAPTHC